MLPLLQSLDVRFAEELRATSKRQRQREPEIYGRPPKAPDDSEACIKLKRSLRLFGFEQTLQRLDACCATQTPSVHPIGGFATAWRSKCELILQVSPCPWC